VAGILSWGQPKVAGRRTLYKPGASTALDSEIRRIMAEERKLLLLVVVAVAACSCVTLGKLNLTASQPFVLKRISISRFVRRRVLIVDWSSRYSMSEQHIIGQSHVSPIVITNCCPTKRSRITV
jgi:hypothetical protein